MAVVFKRHGAARSREIILQLGDNICSAGFWNEMVILNALIGARTAVEAERPLLAGWVTQSWEQLDGGRESRITRLSTDGRTDLLLFETINFDADFCHYYGPLLGPAPPTLRVVASGPDGDNQAESDLTTVRVDAEPPGRGRVKL